MARYLQVVDDLHKQVDAFMELIDAVTVPIPTERTSEVAVALGHIINLAVRACPRSVQHTVRRNIVGGAVSTYCHVTMTQEEDPKTGNTYWKISIVPK